MEQNSLLKAIAEGFKKTPWEISLSIIIIISILIIAFIISYIYKSVMLNQSNIKWIAEYDDMIRKLDLTINELDLIDELSEYLKNPFRKILLLNNKNTFILALSKLEKNKGQKSEYQDNLIIKIFGEQTEQLIARRPVRFINTDGNVYSGRLSSRDGNKVSINEVKQVRKENNTETGSLLIQDFRGIQTHPVSTVKSSGPNSFQLVISESSLPGKAKGKISHAYIMYPKSDSPVETRIKLLEKGTAIIEIPEGQLKVHQAVKISIRTSIKKQFWVNAIVTNVSLNKKYAKLTFGYIK